MPFLLLVVTRLGVGYVFCILNWRIDHASIAAAVHRLLKLVVGYFEYLL